MKTAVIYYSFEGNCALIAEIIRESINSDLFAIKTADEKKRTGFAKYAWGGAQVIMNKKPALLPLSLDINAYDLIILGTPVWAFAPAPAIVSFLDERKISGKKFAIFCCHGGGPGKTLAKLKTLLEGNTIISEIDFLDPTKANREIIKQKINEWIKTLGI